MENKHTHLPKMMRASKNLQTTLMNESKPSLPPVWELSLLSRKQELNASLLYLSGVVCLFLLGIMLPILVVGAVMIS